MAGLHQGLTLAEAAQQQLPKTSSRVVIVFMLAMVLGALSLDIASLFVPWFSRSPQGYMVTYYLTKTVVASTGASPIMHDDPQDDDHGRIDRAQTQTAIMVLVSQLFSCLLLTFLLLQFSGIKKVRMFPYDIICCMGVFSRAAALMLWKYHRPGFVAKYCGTAVSISPNASISHGGCMDETGYTLNYTAFILWGLSLSGCMWISGPQQEIRGQIDLRHRLYKIVSSLCGAFSCIFFIACISLPLITF